MNKEIYPYVTADYKEVTTYVPDWAQWWAISKDGLIYVYENKPYVQSGRSFWMVTSGKLMFIGYGPCFDDWEKHIYKLVPV